MKNLRLMEVVLCHTETVVLRFKARSSECRIWTLLTLLSLCPSHTSLVPLFAILSPQSWVSLVPNQIALISVPRALSQPFPLLPPVPAHLTPARVRAPGPLLSWQENKDSWQWEKPVKENMNAVVVMALLSENSLCQGTALASHTCYMDRCFQLLSLTSLRARFLLIGCYRTQRGLKETEARTQNTSVITLIMFLQSNWLSWTVHPELESFCKHRLNFLLNLSFILVSIFPPVVFLTL